MPPNLLDDLIKHLAASPPNLQAIRAGFAQELYNRGLLCDGCWLRETGVNPTAVCLCCDLPNVIATHQHLMRTLEQQRLNRERQRATSE